MHPSGKMISVLKNYAHYKSGNVTIITHGQPFEFNCLYMSLGEETVTETIHPARPVIKCSVFHLVKVRNLCFIKLGLLDLCRN